MKNKKTLKEKINKGFNIADKFFIGLGVSALIIHGVSKLNNESKFGWYYNENNKIDDEFFMENPNYKKYDAITQIKLRDDFKKELILYNPKNENLEKWIYVPDKDKNGTFAGHALYEKPTFNSKKIK